MKKLDITWKGIYDPTGYMFSFAKSLSCAIKNSPYSKFAEDIVVTSGFAFRMWVAESLCPSATSIWNFASQKPWVESGGVSCKYIERLWGQDDIEEERRVSAIEQIKESIDNNMAAISWDIGVCEWGLIIGYDDDNQKLTVLDITGKVGEMDYVVLGKREIPILNVLTIDGLNNKPQEDIINDTLKLAKLHLTGKEWCENAKGLECYPSLIKHFENENPEFELSWNMEYFLGTYAPMKYYAWKFFEKYDLQELAKLYKTIYECWQEAFKTKKSLDFSLAENRSTIAELLKKAEKCEKEAVKIITAKLGE